MANPQTGIDFESDRFVIRKDGVLTNMNAQWGRLDGGPMVGGLPAGEEWFIKRAPDDEERAKYDHRYAINSEWSCVPYDPPSALGYPTGEYSERVTGIMRPPAELKLQVDTEKMAANECVYPPADKDASAALLADALSRATKDAVDLAVIARHNARLAAMRQNEARALALYADIDAGRTYDILAGWTYAAAATA